MNIELTANKLYEDLVSYKLNEIQKEKLNYACKKAILENPQLEYNGWKTACKIYLDFIIDFPELDLGGIKIPDSQSELHKIKAAANSKGVVAFEERTPEALAELTK